MFSDNSDQSWEKFGASDPYFAILPDEKYHKSRLDRAVVEQFFASGETTINHLLDVIRSDLVPDFEPQSALDFGCGVGRLTLSLAAICDSVVGVDVSDSMLDEARRNSAERNRSNITFVKSDDTLSQVSGRFDFGSCSELV